jgi:hypothetical protein
MFFLNTQPVYDLFGRPYKLHLRGEELPEIELNLVTYKENIYDNRTRCDSGNGMAVSRAF